MTTKKYASKKLQTEATWDEPKNPAGTKMKKRAMKHNLDGTKQNTLVTQSLNEIKKNRR